MRLKWHLVRLVLAALLPVVVLATALLAVLVQQERATRIQSMQDVARNLSLSVDSELQRSITALEVLALSTRLARGDLQTFRARAQAVKELHPSWSNLLVFDSGGRQVLNLQYPAGVELPRLTQIDPIHEAVRTGRPQVSDLIQGAMTGRHLTYIAVPVEVDGEVRFVLEAAIYSDAWTAWLRARTPPGWTAAIDDRGGRVLARGEAPERFVGRQAAAALREEYARRESGVMKVVGLPGVPVYVAYHRAPFSGWHAVMVMPAEALEGGPYLTGLAWGGGALLVIAAGALFAGWNARRLTRDIAGLTAAIGELGAGRPARKVTSAIAEVEAAAAAAAEASRLLAQRAEDVASLQAQLAERAAAAESLSQAKDRFIAMLSHELRNPLSAIANAVRVLRHPRGSGQLTEAMTALLDRQTRHLSFLVDDLLEMSKLATGKVRLDAKPLDLAAVVRDVADTMQAAGRFREHHLQLHLQPAWVEGDAGRLGQVVGNLLDNAVKYTPAGGRIEVETGTVEGAPRLSVRDTGVGLDQTLGPQLFEPFVQAEQDLARAAGGLGLGLAIVRRIVELHGGKVGVRSGGPGQGSEFFVELPAAAGVRAEVADQAA